MKRSSQVVLLLMGATGVGAGAYAMTPRTNCVAPSSPPAAIAPAVPGMPAAQPCPPGSRSSGGSYFYRSHWSRPIFSRTSTSATPSGSVPLVGRGSTPGVPRSSTTSSQRGGFGSTGHAMSSSSSS